jgi:hypothetical protein
MNEAGLEPASMRHPEKRNPVTQFGLWEVLESWFVRLGQVRQGIDDLADRYRIELETSWDDLDIVRAAYFRVGRIGFAISRHPRNPVAGTMLWVLREDLTDSALPSLLGLFGLAEGDIMWRPAADQ